MAFRRKPWRRVCEFCLKEIMHSVTAGWFPQLWWCFLSVLVTWGSTRTSHLHTLEKPYSKSKCKSQSMSVQQLAVISILHKLTTSRKYLFIYCDFCTRLHCGKLWLEQRTGGLVWILPESASLCSVQKCTLQSLKTLYLWCWLYKSRGVWTE